MILEVYVLVQTVAGGWFYTHRTTLLLVAPAPTDVNAYEGERLTNSLLLAKALDRVLPPGRPGVAAGCQSPDQQGLSQHSLRPFHVEDRDVTKFSAPAACSLQP